MPELSCASLERIMKAAGAKRVSAGAVIILSEALEDFGTKISREAVELARHANRKTVKKEDIKLAVRRLVNGPY